LKGDYTDGFIMFRKYCIVGSFVAIKFATVFEKTHYCIFKLSQNLELFSRVKFCQKYGIDG